MRMKKFINDPEHLVSELLEGLALAFPDKIRLVSNSIVARRDLKSSEKVRLITLGGSGHEPGLAALLAKACWTSVWRRKSSRPPVPRSVLRRCEALAPMDRVRCRSS